MINFFKWIFGKGEDEGSEMITLDEVLTTSQEFFTDVAFDDLREYFKGEVEGVLCEDLEIDHDCLTDIEEQTISGFNESWKVLETIEEQRHYLRLTVVQCVEKFVRIQGYFSVGNRKVRAKVFKEIQHDNAKLEPVGQDEYEKDLYLELIRFRVNYWIALYLLREHLDDGREENYPARFTYEYDGYVDTEFKRLLALAEKDNGKVDLYENELEAWDKQVQVQRGKVLSFWDVTCETMLSQGYDTNMVCDN